MAGTCGMMGGRRRRHRTKKTRKMKGGNGYGFTGTPSDVINAGNIAWTPNMTSVPNGQPVVGSVTGGRRKSRKATKKGRKGRKRTMKGGGSVAGVGYGFAGTGARGLSDPIPYASKLPPGPPFEIPTGTR